MTETYDLVIAHTDYTAQVHYEDPDCIIVAHIGTGSIGLKLGHEGEYDFVYFSSIHAKTMPPFDMSHLNQGSGAFFVPNINLRVIGQTTKELFFGYPTINYPEIIKPLDVAMEVNDDE